MKQTLLTNQQILFKFQQLSLNALFLVQDPIQVVKPPQSLPVCDSFSVRHLCPWYQPFTPPGMDRVQVCLCVWLVSLDQHYCPRGQCLALPWTNGPSPQQCHVGTRSRVHCAIPSRPPEAAKLKSDGKAVRKYSSEASLVIRPCEDRVPSSGKGCEP